MAFGREWEWNTSSINTHFRSLEDVHNRIHVQVILVIASDLMCTWLISAYFNSAFSIVALTP